MHFRSHGNTASVWVCLSESRLLYLTVHHTFYKMNLLLLLFFFRFAHVPGDGGCWLSVFSVSAPSVSHATIFTPACCVFRAKALSCYLLTDIDVLSSPRKRLLLLLPECLTWLTESCLSVSQPSPASPFLHVNFKSQLSSAKHVAAKGKALHCHQRHAAASGCCAIWH